MRSSLVSTSLLDRPWKIVGLRFSKSKFKETFCEASRIFSDIGNALSNTGILLMFRENVFGMHLGITFVRGQFFDKFVDGLMAEIVPKHNSQSDVVGGFFMQRRFGAVTSQKKTALTATSLKDPPKGTLTYLVFESKNSS